MRSVRCVSLAVAAAIVTTIFAERAGAQDPPPAAEQAPAADAASETVVLPQVSVETEAAPAKRNKQKVALKKGAGNAAAPGVPNEAALPGIVVEGEKVLR